MSVGGIERDTSAKLLEGVFDVVLLEVGDAEVFAKIRRVGAKSKGAFVERDCADGVTGLDAGESVVCKSRASGSVGRSVGCGGGSFKDG